MTDSLDELQRSIIDWLDDVHPDRTLSSSILKLVEETGELADDPLNAAEAADVLILILDIAHQMRYDILHITKMKMEINRSRTWAKNPDGSISHIKEEK